MIRPCCETGLLAGQPLEVALAGLPGDGAWSPVPPWPLSLPPPVAPPTGSLLWSLI